MVKNGGGFCEHDKILFQEIREISLLARRLLDLQEICVLWN